MLSVFSVFVVCLNDASAVEVDVYVSSTVEGTRARNPDTPHMAEIALFHVLCAVDSLEELVDTMPIDHG
jgi:hypothetical protein